MNQHGRSDWKILRREDGYSCCKIIKGHEVGGSIVLGGLKGEHRQDAFINSSEINKNMPNG